MEFTVARINNKFDFVLAMSGYSIQLEGIYGSFGDHMFEIRKVRSSGRSIYLGAFSGVYECESE